MPAESKLPPAGVLPPAGDRIGPYRIERPLGQGGMGEVFLARDERLGRPVALKRIRAAAARTPERRERFRREARAVASLSHPAIVQLYDVQESEDELTLVFELVPGRTVAELLQEGPLSLPQALRIAGEVAEGLAAIHEAGIVHRDLKAENVMVTPEGCARILDFGLALSPLQEAGRLTADGSRLGTWRAMSPEQVRGEEVDARSDLFSLGVLLVEMLTGASPFLGAHPADTLQRICEAPPPPLAALRPALPRELIEIIERLLAKDRAVRPESAGAVAQALARLAACRRSGWSELPTGSLSARERPAGAGRPRRPLSGWIAFGSLLAVGLGVAWLERPAPPRRILVLSPAVAGSADAATDLAASGVFSSVLGTLSGIAGLAPLDATALGEPGALPLPLARQAAAQEIVRSSLERDGGMLRITLTRLRPESGEVLWTDSFRTPADSESLRLLAEAVALRLRGAYPDLPARPRAPDWQVRDADYNAFLEVRHRLYTGAAATRADLGRLDAILQSSPRFPSGHLLAAEVALALFRTHRDSAALDRASAHAAEALRLASQDPRALSLTFQVALIQGKSTEAEERLTTLDSLLPGSPEVLLLRAQLAESRGDTAAALAALRSACRLSPLWQNLYRLADFAARHGEVSEARERLAELLARQPKNQRVREKWGEMELLYGDPRAAETIYRELAAEAPLRAFFTNLGLARFLLGDSAGAVMAYRQALTLDPGHSAVTLNLADALEALGRNQEAAELYRQVLSRLDAAASAAPLDPLDRMARAQCLARLHRAQEAIETTQQALRELPDHPEVIYQAALVYALTGERVSALVNARRALDEGIQPRWLQIPPFRALQEDPEWPVRPAS